MESPASGVDSYSDADSRFSSPSCAHAAKRRKPNSADCTVEGSLIKWWTEVRGSDRQPWELPSPHHPPHRARPPPTPGTANTVQPPNSAVRSSTQSRAQKTGKRGGKVTLVSPPAGRSCGPFMCHGLHNSYLIDERSAILKENPSTARIAAEKKKALTPKPFLVGARGAASGAPGVTAKRTLPWRILRLKAAKDAFPLKIDAPEEEAWRIYREKQLSSGLRLAAIQNRKLRQQVNVRSSTATGVVGSSDTLKVGDCLRVLSKHSDASEEDPAAGDDETGLSKALFVLPTDHTLGDSHPEGARDSPKNGKHKLPKVAKWQKDSLAKKASQPKIQLVAKKSGSPSLTTTSVSFGVRREPQRKLAKPKSRTVVKAPSRTGLLKKNHSARKQMQRKRCQTVDVPAVQSSAPVSLCVQVKSCVEGTRTDVYNMFGSPAAAHARGVVDTAREHHVRGQRRRSESQLVSAASSEAAKWLANRSGVRRQAAGLPVVQLLLPSAGDLRQPPGDARTAAIPGGRRSKLAINAPSHGPIAVSALQFTNRSGPPQSEHSVKGSKKWANPPRRREGAAAEQAGSSTLRRYFGAPSSRLSLDEIEQDFNIDWSEILRPAREKTRANRSGYESYKSFDTDMYSDIGNDYLDLEHTEVDRNPNIPSKLRMLGNLPNQLFGRSEKGYTEEEATLMRMGFSSKQKACMETQVTPRIKEANTPTLSRRLPQGRAQVMEQVDAKRNVEVSTGGAVSAENAIPLAFRREGGNQAFKTVLDMVLENAQGRSCPGSAGGSCGGGGGDTRKGGGFGGRQGGGDFSMFRNFLSQALKTDDIPSTPTGPSFSFDNSQYSSYRGKNLFEPRKSHPKSADERMKLLSPSRHIAGVRVEKQKTMSEYRKFAERSNLERSINLSPTGGGSRVGRMFTEKKSPPKISGLMADGCGELVSTHGSQPPAISRTRAITSANLGDLMATLRRAEKLS